MTTELGCSAEMGLARRKAIAGFTITEFCQPPLRRLPVHEHRDASICFVLSGDYRESVGSRHRECTAHSVVFKPAGERHSDEFGREGGRCLLIEIDPARLPAIEGSSGVTRRVGFARGPALTALGHQIYSEFTVPDAFSSLAVEGLTLELVAHASRALAAERSGVPPRWLRQALELLHDEAGGSPTLGGLARAVGIHPSHLARTFRKHYRLSVGEYLRRLRIERASGELAATDKSVAEIGLAAGFFDQSHFSRVFKAQVGLSPGEFRRVAGSLTPPPTRSRRS